MAGGVDRTVDGVEPVLDHAVVEVVAQVQRTTGAAVDVIGVRELVEREWSRHHDARVRTFLPVLVRRAVVDQVVGSV